MKKAEFLRLLETTLEIEANVLTEESDLAGLEEFDSFAIMALIVLIDEKFEKSLSAEDFENISTVASFVKIIGENNFED